MKVKEPLYDFFIGSTLCYCVSNQDFNLFSFGQIKGKMEMDILTKVTHSYIIYLHCHEYIIIC